MVKILTVVLSLLSNLLFAGITDDNFWKEIEYGWVCPDSMDLTEETIFSNTNKIQVGATDMIEVMLGLHERCLVTQTGSNSYIVVPRNQVETFSELIYSAGTVLTNSITKTNAIGYFINSTPFDYDYLGEVGFSRPCPFDAYLSGGAIPQYFDTNTVYDGSTNFSLYTASNLYHKLNLDFQVSLGDPGLRIVPSFGTNVFTNFLICYTQDTSSLTYAGDAHSNYYIGNTQYYFGTRLYFTNYVTSTQTYLSPYPQTVNYAISTKGLEPYIYASYWYTATQHIRWVYSLLKFNYTNVLMGTLHVVNFTNYPWYSIERIYPDYNSLWLALGGGTYWEYYSLSDVINWGEDYGKFYDRYNTYREVLQDRYKVLNALQNTAPTFSYTGFSRTVSMSSNHTDMAGLAALKILAEEAFTNAPVAADAQTPYAYAQIKRRGRAPADLNWTVTLKRSYGIWKIGYVNTNVAHDKPQAYVRGRLSSALWTFDNQGDTIYSTNSYALSAESVEADARTNYYTIIVGSESLAAPTTWPDTPTNRTTWTKGYLTDATDRKVVISWKFLYCTNKYW